jgi:hypothetical protein
MSYTKYRFTPRKSAFRVMISRRRTVRPLFFESTVDGAVYRDTALQFVDLLELNELDCWFHEDDATGHITNET